MGSFFWNQEATASGNLAIYIRKWIVKFYGKIVYTSNIFSISKREPQLAQYISNTVEHRRLEPSKIRTQIFIV